jgi:hypothetical protein
MKGIAYYYTREPNEIDITQPVKPRLRRALLRYQFDTEFEMLSRGGPEIPAVQEDP